MNSRLFYASLNPNMSVDDLRQLAQDERKHMEEMTRRIREGLDAMPSAEAKARYLAAALPLLYL